jgi:hypothetical protein
MTVKIQGPAGFMILGRDRATSLNIRKRALGCCGTAIDAMLPRGSSANSRELKYSTCKQFEEFIYPTVCAPRKHRIDSVKLAGFMILGRDRATSLNIRKRALGCCGTAIDAMLQKHLTLLQIPEN